MSDREAACNTVTLLDNKIIYCDGILHIATEAKGHLLSVFPQVTQHGTKVFLSGDDASPPPPPPRNDDRIITPRPPLVETCH